MFEAGKYYVGDLCYVLTEANGWNWSSLLDATENLGVELPHDETTGYYLYSGTKLFSSGTHYGDGSYPDQDGREYLVDAGIIGCIPIECIGEKANTDGGHVINFSRAFSCYKCDSEGLIKIGHIQIDTKLSYEDDEEDCWECGSQYCDGDCYYEDDEED